MLERFSVAYSSAQAFLEAYDLELANGGLVVRGAQPTPGVSACEVEVKLAETTLGVVKADIDRVGRVGMVVRFDDLPAAISSAAQRLRHGEAAENEEPATTTAPGTMADRVAELSVSQKIQLAHAGEREARIALLRDSNKLLHAYVLRNPRITTEEVLFAAKLTTLSAEALKLIGESAQWCDDSRIRTAVVRNPSTPATVALNLLAKLPPADLRAIAKGGARDALVQAARRLITR